MENTMADTKNTSANSANSITDKAKDLIGDLDIKSKIEELKKELNDQKELILNDSEKEDDDAAEIRALESSLIFDKEIGDYKIIKIMEARLQNKPDPYDVNDLIAKREAARTKINDLESKIDEIEKNTLSVKEKIENLEHQIFKLGD